jgi:hypothetical protein
MEGTRRSATEPIFGVRLLHESLRTENLTISNMRCDESLRTGDESSSASDKGKEGSCKELQTMAQCVNALRCYYVRTAPFDVTGWLGEDARVDLWVRGVGQPGTWWWWFAKPG